MFLTDANGPMVTVTQTETPMVMTSPMENVATKETQLVPSPVQKVKPSFNWGWLIGIVLVAGVVIVIIRRALKK